MLIFNSVCLLPARLYAETGNLILTVKHYEQQTLGINRFWWHPKMSTLPLFSCFNLSLGVPAQAQNEFFDAKEDMGLVWCFHGTLLVLQWGRAERQRKVFAKRSNVGPSYLCFLTHFLLGQRPEHS